VRLLRRAAPLTVGPHSHMLRKCMRTFAVVVLSILDHALIYERTAHLLRLVRVDEETRSKGKVTPTSSLINLILLQLVKKRNKILCLRNTSDVTKKLLFVREKFSKKKCQDIFD